MSGFWKMSLRDTGTIDIQGRPYYNVGSTAGQDYKERVRLLITKYRNKLVDSEIDHLELLDEANFWSPIELDVVDEVWQDVVVDGNRG